MSRHASLFLVGAFALAFGTNAGAEHVRGYTKKDGTYVAPYERGSTRHSSPNSSAPKAATPGTSQSAPASVPRGSDGRIQRSSSARTAFEKSHPCPSTGKTSGACPGYVVDHVTPLKRGGADKPENMQWQTVEAARAKDKVE